MSELGAEATRLSVADQLPASPYVGLVPYTESETALFFGRDSERQIIAANLVASRLTLLYGSSGVGKSSVLTAGVAPDLRARGGTARQDPRRRELQPAVFSSWAATDPVASIIMTLAQSVEQSLEPGVVELAPISDSLSETLRVWSKQTGLRFLIVLDQFEDYFQNHGEEEGGRTGFALQFSKAVNDPSIPVNFLVAIREDSMALLDIFKGGIGALFGNYLRLPHLGPAQARQAIEKPLIVYSQLLLEAGHIDQPYEIEAELTEEVLREVETGKLDPFPADNPGTPPTSPRTLARIEAPYLQLVMSRLWAEEQESGSHTLRLETLVKLGGAGEIVRTYLDNTMRELSVQDQDIAEKAFRQLVTRSGVKITLSGEDLADLSDLPEERLTPLLNLLALRRILRPVAPVRGQPAASRYEIHHDTLGPAILDWRRRHRENRELALERERQRRRWRLVAACVLAGLLLLSGAVAVFVNDQQRKVRVAEAQAAGAEKALEAFRVQPEGVAATSEAPAGEDACGTRVNFDPERVSDGDPQTAWRTPGDGVGETLTLLFAAPIRVTTIGLIPGYAKIDPCSGTDRFTQNRIIQRVEYGFSDGSSIQQRLRPSRAIQYLDVQTVTEWITMRILQTGPHGGRNYAVISELEVYGEPAQ